MKEKDITDYTLEELVAHHSGQEILALGKGNFKMYDALYTMAVRALYWKHEKDRLVEKENGTTNGKK